MKHTSLKHTIVRTSAIILVTGFAFSGSAQQNGATPAPATAAVSAKKPVAATAAATPPAAAKTAMAPAAPAPAAGSSAAPAQAAAPAANATAASAGQTVSPTPLAPKEIEWAFNGMRGYVDVQSAQRGFQVYKQVCSACHSMNLVAYRSLSGLGFSEGEIKALAAEKQIPDMDDKGQAIERAGKPFDHFAPPFPNEDASRAANNGAYPPDLSLIIKAREDGPNYVYSILTGFGPAPANEPPVSGKYYNPYFPGHWISMPPPLSEGVVTYQDGTPATVDQMARDVVTFLQWAAEPEMQQRNEMGIKVLIFLFIMGILFYVAKKRVWKNISH